MNPVLVADDAQTQRSLLVTNWLSQEIDTFPALKQSLRYQLLSNLQHSLFGVVKLCWDNLTRQQVCVKVSYKKNSDAQNAISGPNVMESVRTEAALLRFLTKQASTSPKHNNNENEKEALLGARHVVQFIDELEDESFHYLITECCDQDMLKVLLQNKETKLQSLQEQGIVHVGLPENTARVYFTQLVQAVAFLHLNQVSHIDLSIENVCLTTTGNQIKLIDFGLAILHPESPHYQSIMLSTTRSSNAVPGQSSGLRKIGFVNQTPSNSDCLFLCQPIQQSASDKTNKQVIARPGKNRYMSPEMYAGNIVWNAYAHDCYALGVILFMLLTGCPAYKLPIRHDKWFDLIYSGLWRTSAILNQPTAQQIYGHLSENAIDLIDQIIKPEARRLTLKQILAHPWVQLR